MQPGIVAGVEVTQSQLGCLTTDLTGKRIAAVVGPSSVGFCSEDYMDHPVEIERKFLVTNKSYRELAKPAFIAQGYLNSDKLRTVRVRLEEGKAFLTIKSITTGLSRQEFEYPVPLDDGKAILKLCEEPIIEKNRFRVPYEGMVWEIDEYAGENLGLVVAEVEISNEADVIQLPAWIGEEVSHDPRYFNSNLVRHPFSKWQ